MKKKLILGLVASVLALTLAIGGTLMLFTAQSETATNVVTLGNAAIALQEKNDDNQFQTIVSDEESSVFFPGNKFEDQQPGDDLDKEPRVVNTGSIPVYVKVTGEISFMRDAEKLGWGDIADLITEAVDAAIAADEIDLSDFDNVILGQPDYDEGQMPEGWEEQVKYNYAFLSLVLKDGVSNEWFGVPVIAADGTFYGAWYYVGKSSPTLLAPLGVVDQENDFDGGTESIFTTVNIPIELGNDAQDIKISLNLQAFAVQYDNNAIVTENGAAQSISDWEAIFSVFA
jgi:predicted ribosomally synthesized peptide with SipW-like signal peptide